jgi:hypothetical protein
VKIITDNKPRTRNHNETPNSVLLNIALENINQPENKQRARNKVKKEKILRNSSASIEQECGEKFKKNKKINEKKKIQQHERNFFYGFQEGIKLSSRLATGVFGKIIIVDGLKISLYDSPPCFRKKNVLSDEDCEACEYFSPRECLLRFDDYLFEDLNRFIAIRAEQQVEQVKRKQIVSDIIHKELLSHGRPLHYSMISKIIIGRYPKLHLTENSIRRFLEWHPELFERIEEGIYRAK